MDLSSINNSDIDPVVDIIMATYNGDRYISEQIDSIINQSYKNWRLIIRDDGSSDRTLHIIKKHAIQEPRIVIIEDNLGNLGFNKNFIKLLNSTSADYISICDQDDVWLPNKLALSCKFLQDIEKEEKKPSLVHCDASLVNSSLHIISERWIGSRGLVYSLPGLVFANSVQGAATMINRNLKKIALEIIPEIPYDYHLALLALFKGNRFYIDQPLLKYRQHSGNAIGALGTNEKLSVRHYFKQLIEIIVSILKPLKYEKLTPSLKSGLIAYHIIKKTYITEPIPPHLQESVRKYTYVFEGKSRLKKLHYFLTESFAFSRKKDYWICFILIAIGRDLKHPQNWK